MHKLLISVFLLASFFAQSQDFDSLKIAPPKLYPNWTLLVPGATHFYDGRFAEGLVFSAFEIGGVALGLAYDSRLKEHGSTAYTNYPLFIGLKTLDVDKCDFVRNRLEFIKYHRPDFKYDDLSFRELLRSPFKPKNFLTPITGTFVAIALAELLITSNPGKYKFKNASQMYFLDRYIDRDPALATFGATSLALSWEAGVSEEYFFRNALMPILDYRLGQKKGLLISSAVFGAGHALNYIGVDNPDPLTIIYHVSSATLFGYILGRNVQKHDYKIGQAVAAHMWYDFTLMLGSFLLDPKNNVFGVDIKFNL